MPTLRACAVILPILAVAACASGGARQTARHSAAVDCGAGKTLVCEVQTTSRIKHGSFSNGSKSCSCEDGHTGPPVIPSIH